MCASFARSAATAPYGASPGGMGGSKVPFFIFWAEPFFVNEPGQGKQKRSLTQRGKDSDSAHGSDKDAKGQARDGLVRRANRGLAR